MTLTADRSCRINGHFTFSALSVAILMADSICSVHKFNFDSESLQNFSHLLLMLFKCLVPASFDFDKSYVAILHSNEIRPAFFDDSIALSFQFLSNSYFRFVQGPNAY